ncbi:MAG: ethanolamine ammonia-lyase light chain EutC, partial [Bacteroidales bacterium]|nr:ethanolamine ammonia-lyase light chain EutC [Bacteroidales bacterium]
SAGTLGFLVTTAFVALVYLTYNPRIGRLDSERNCISNVRPEGLTYEKAAFKMAWLIQSAFSLRQTGIALKDESDLGLLMG